MTSDPRHRVLFADEARVGQKNTITRAGLNRGRASQALPKTANRSASIFGADLSQDGTGAALVLPRCTRSDEPPSRRNRHPDPRRERTPAAGRSVRLAVVARSSAAPTSL